MPTTQSDVVTASLARGLRRHADTGLVERINRLMDDSTLGVGGRFGVIVRRRHEHLIRTFGASRVYRAENLKRLVSWAIAYPESAEHDRLVVSYFQRRNSHIERECLPTGFTCTAHCRERMIQIAHPEPIPLALLLWKIGDACVSIGAGRQEGTLFAAFSFGLLIGQCSEVRGVELRTVISGDALGPRKRALWESLLRRPLSVEVRPTPSNGADADGLEEQ